MNNESRIVIYDKNNNIVTIILDRDLKTFLIKLLLSRKEKRIYNKKHIFNNDNIKALFKLVEKRKYRSVRSSLSEFLATIRHKDLVKFIIQKRKERVF
jgi:dipeptidase